MSIIECIAILDDIIKAREKSRKAECDSDLLTEDEGNKRKRKRKKVFSSSDEYESDHTIEAPRATFLKSPFDFGTSKQSIFVSISLK